MEFINTYINLILILMGGWIIALNIFHFDEVTSIKLKLESIESDVGSIKSDVSSIHPYVIGIQEDVSSIQDYIKDKS